ncbi:MAG: SIS domain-containing protein [Patescibacteria group bacterium]|nr:SIS domain-containing protein [Patescibacteria group bacterium]
MKEETTKRKIQVNNNAADLHEFIDAYLCEIKRCLEALDKNKLELAIDMLIKAYKNDRKVFILGNGGSASTASHMACDLSKGTLQRVYDYKEKRLKIISLTDNVALMTAFANDLSFEDIFIQQLRNLVETNDLVIALSGSGNSLNVVKAIRYARTRGAKTIGLLGFKSGGKVAKLVDCSIIVNSTHYGPIEDIQLILNHLIASWIAKVKNIYDGRIGKENKNKSVPFR